MMNDSSSMMPPGAVTLALECAAGPLSVALFKGGELLAEESGLHPLGRAEELSSVVRNVMHGRGAEEPEIGSIVVSSGPGSYTGIRTGIAFAKGLAAATGAAVHLVSLASAIAAHRLRLDPVGSIVMLGRKQLALELFRPGSPSEISNIDVTDIAVALQEAREAGISEWVADSRARAVLGDVSVNVEYTKASFSVLLGRAGQLGLYEQSPNRYLASRF